MMTAKLTIKEQATGNEAQVSATFNEDETKRLEAYYRYVEELSEVKLLKDGFPAGEVAHALTDLAPLWC